MKVAINDVEYNVWNIDDFLNVQKVLNGCFVKMLEDQAREQVTEEMRTQIIEEYWYEASHGNNDVQREIKEGVIDIPAIYDGIVKDLLLDTEYDSIDDMNEDNERMKASLEEIYRIAEDWY